MCSFFKQNTPFQFLEAVIFPISKKQVRDAFQILVVSGSFFPVNPMTKSFDFILGNKNGSGSKHVWFSF